MILKNDFYQIKETQRTDKGVNFTVQLNAGHFIYAAHFPGNPITPGVCLMQMVKELTEEFVQTPLFLKVVKNVKFIQIINPLVHPEVSFVLTVLQEDETEYRVSAGVESGGDTFCKMSLLFIKKGIS
jgi:3-hydroxyacyl-[acyl-carrier-protein] dehydratase